jgi:hypothetical protein
MAERYRARVYVSPAPAPDPVGRVDVLLLRSGELGVRILESFLRSRGVQVGDLWSGSEGFRELIGRFCNQNGLTGVNVFSLLSPVDMAERAGVLKRPGRRRRIA